MKKIHVDLLHDQSLSNWISYWFAVCTSVHFFFLFVVGYTVLQFVYFTFYCVDSSFVILVCNYCTHIWFDSVNISDEDVAYWNSKGVLPSLTIDQIRDVARVFVNGKLAGIYLQFIVLWIICFNISFKKKKIHPQKGVISSIY